LQKSERKGNFLNGWGEKNKQSYPNYLRTDPRTTSVTING